VNAPILVTGATGFIGQNLCPIISQQGLPFRAAVRRAVPNMPSSIQVGEIDGATDWSEALDGIDSVIHLAGRAHVLKDVSTDPLAEFRRVNTDGTLNLAKQMVENGCKRLVFVSTIGVNGDATPIDQPFTEDSTPNPQLPYALAKWEAEQGLEGFKDRLEIVVVRPPLVYGPNAPGNFGQLVRWIERGVPLPLGSARNQRSLIAVQNLCDFLIQCAQHPNVAGETFLVSDGEDLSTPELLESVARALGRRVTLFPVPEIILRLPLRLLGRERIVDQLFGSLVVDSSKARGLLNWSPPLSVYEAIRTLKPEAT